jgi:hypothetical protein
MIAAEACIMNFSCRLDGHIILEEGGFLIDRSADIISVVFTPLMPNILSSPTQHHPLSWSTL